MRKNASSNFYLLIGRVEGLDDEGDTYAVTLSYEVYNRIRKAEETMFTTVYFKDPNKSRFNGRCSVPWAQIAKTKNLRYGSVVAIIVSFPGTDFSEAYGYAIHYSGRVWLGEQDREENGNEEEKYAIGGTITWMNEKVDRKGTPYLAMNVFFGYDKYGNAASTIVQVRSPELIARCKKILMPRDDGTRFSAWFKCGVPYRYSTKNGRNQEIYTAFDMTMTGCCKTKTEVSYENKENPDTKLPGQEF